MDWETDQVGILFDMEVSLCYFWQGIIGRD